MLVIVARLTKRRFFICSHRNVIWCEAVHIFKRKSKDGLLNSNLKKKCGCFFLCVHEFLSERYIEKVVVDDETPIIYIWGSVSFFGCMVPACLCARWSSFYVFVRVCCIWMSAPFPYMYCICTLYSYRHMIQKKLTFWLWEIYFKFW